MNLDQLLTIVFILVLRLQPEANDEPNHELKPTNVSLVVALLINRIIL